MSIGVWFLGFKLENEAVGGCVWVAFAVCHQDENWRKLLLDEAKVEKTFHLQKYFSFSFVVSSQTPHPLMPRLSFAGLLFLFFISSRFQLDFVCVGTSGTKVPKSLITFAALLRSERCFRTPPTPPSFRVILSGRFRRFRWISVSLVRCETAASAEVAVPIATEAVSSPVFLPPMPLWRNGWRKGNASSPDETRE